MLRFLDQHKVNAIARAEKTFTRTCECFSGHTPRTIWLTRVLDFRLHCSKALGDAVAASFPRCERLHATP
jgi:hypothetical protein